MHINDQRDRVRGPARAPSVVVVLLAAAALALGAAGPAFGNSSPSLRILITNDDGWRGANGADTPLIVALRDALRAAGHRVTVVAPDSDQSGTGTRISLFRPLTLVNPGPSVWTVSGSPGDSVFLGTNVLFNTAKPDLVVSGINPGGNYSSLAIHSGTVGAALSALELGIPAIAVSIDGSTAQSVAAKDAAAAYTVRLIAALAARGRRGRLLPDGVGLNVNYPAQTTPKKTVLTYQDPNSYFSWSYGNSTGAFGQPGVYNQVFGAPTAAPSRGSDWEAITKGEISITPIDDDLTAHLPPADGLLQFLTRVTP